MSLIVRPYVPGPDDAARLEIYNRAHEEDDDFVPDTLEDLRRWDRSPDTPNFHRFIAELDGRPVGSVLANVDPRMAEKKGFMYGPNVMPEFRRRGVGAALARAALGDLRGRGMEQAEARERDRASSNAFLASLGFKPVRAFSQMRRSLAGLPAVPAGSQGIEVALADPTDENLAAVVNIDNEAFREHYNYRPVSLELLRFYQQAIADEGSVGRISLARAGGQPVGYLIYGYEPRTFERLKVKRGGLWDLGVLKPYRRQGIATTLLTAAMRHLQAEGLEEVELYVDDLNATGARRLYERLGFTLARRDLAHVRDLTPDCPHLLLGRP